ncbi:MAG: hypothetical protein Q9160_001424 [Pyrenula sp. 1 TL-2023]
MASKTAAEEGVWPSAPIVVDDRVKRLINRFFAISDSADTSSGRLFADELFTRDGVFKTHETCVFRGRDGRCACPFETPDINSEPQKKEIATSRENNHPATASRAHHLFHISAANSPATDVVVLGKFDIGLKDGNSVDFDFTARFVVAVGAHDEEEHKLQYVQVWTDPTKMIAAFRKAEETLGQEGME